MNYYHRKCEKISNFMEFNGKSQCIYECYRHIKFLHASVDSNAPNGNHPKRSRKRSPNTVSAKTGGALQKQLHMEIDFRCVNSEWHLTLLYMQPEQLKKHKIANAREGVIITHVRQSYACTVIFDAGTRTDWHCRSRVSINSRLLRPLWQCMRQNCGCWFRRRITRKNEYRLRITFSQVLRHGTSMQWNENVYTVGGFGLKKRGSPNDTIFLESFVRHIAGVNTRRSHYSSLYGLCNRVRVFKRKDR